MEKHILTSTEYRLYRSCPTKVLHFWEGLPTKSDAFADYLAAESGVVRSLLPRLFCDVVTPGGRTSAENTIQLLQQEHLAVLDAVLEGVGFRVRCSVLLRSGDTLHVMQAGSAIGSMDEHEAGKMLITMYDQVRSCWRELVDSLALRVAVAEAVFPKLRIRPWLILPETERVMDAEQVEWLQVPGDERVPPCASDVDAWRRNSLLQFFDAEQAVDLVWPSTIASMEGLRRLKADTTRRPPQLRYACRNCEFRTLGHEGESGFKRCWGELAAPDPHLFDLHQLYSLRAPGGTLLADKKIEAGQVSLGDLTIDECAGEHQVRQRMQLTHQLAGTEWVDPELADAMSHIVYPLRFLDFETISPVIPWYAGLRPGALMPFQWSCHTVDQDGYLHHADFLHAEDSDPTLAFVRSLQAELGDTGTILIYTDYEVQVIKNCIGRLACSGATHVREIRWLLGLLESGRIVDQHDLVYKYFFHPRMAGRTSLKVAFPAVWEASATLRSHPWFEAYNATTPDGKVVDPYELLPDVRVAGATFEVNEGCGAMAAYREMMHGVGTMNASFREDLANALKRYCHLDTLAQVYLWEYWRERVG